MILRCHAQWSRDGIITAHGNKMFELCLAWLTTQFVIYVLITYWLKNITSRKIYEISPSARHSTLETNTLIVFWALTMLYKPNPFWKWPRYISMSDFRPLKVTVRKTQARNYHQCYHNHKVKTNTWQKCTKWNIAILAKPETLVSHLEVSLWKIWSGCNKNSDGESTLIFTLHGHMKKSKSHILKYCQKFQFWKFTKKARQT